jgi:hypothetical protein
MSSAFTRCRRQIRPGAFVLTQMSTAAWSTQTITSDDGIVFNKWESDYSQWNDVRFTDDSDTGLVNNGISLSESPKISNLTRNGTAIQPTHEMSLRQLIYGKGKEARQTAKYIRYPMALSPIAFYLQARQIEITKIGLTQLIVRLLAIIPLEQRPHGPTRNQKRVKGGLLYWLDHNASVLFPYLRFAL